jgi:hypothetical protein
VCARCKTLCATLEATLAYDAGAVAAERSCAAERRCGAKSVSPQPRDNSYSFLDDPTQKPRRGQTAATNIRRPRRPRAGSGLHAVTGDVSLRRSTRVATQRHLRFRYPPQSALLSVSTARTLGGGASHAHTRVSKGSQEKAVARRVLSTDLAEAIQAREPEGRCPRLARVPTTDSVRQAIFQGCP